MVYFLARMIAFLFILQMLTLEACGEENKEIIYDSTSMNKWESTPPWDWLYMAKYNYWIFCPSCENKVDRCKQHHNVLWTNYIDASGADLLGLKIRFTIIKSCSCKEASLSILSYQSAGKTNTEMLEKLSNYEYNVVDIFANSSFVIQEKLESIPISKKGVHIGFKINGGCIAILDVKIYPLYCATYKKTNSGTTICQDYGYVKPSSTSLIDNLTFLEGTSASLFTARPIIDSDGDWDQASTTLVVQDVPDPVTNLSWQCFKDHVIINWGAGNDNGSPILNYIVEFISIVPISAVVESSSLIFLPPTNFSTSLKMSPWRRHSFQVIAKNKIGESNPSIDFICDAPADVPFKNPDNVQVKYIEPKTLLVSWTPMSERDHNGPDFHYMIYWKKNSDEKWNCEVVLDWQRKEFQFEVPELGFFDGYNVKVVAANHLGVSKEIGKEIIVERLTDETKERMVWSLALPAFLIIFFLSILVFYIWKKKVYSHFYTKKPPVYDIFLI